MDKFKVVRIKITYLDVTTYQDIQDNKVTPNVYGLSVNNVWERVNYKVIHVHFTINKGIRDGK